MYGELNFNPALFMDGLIYIALPFCCAFIIVAIIVHTLIAIKNQKIPNEDNQSWQ